MARPEGYLEGDYLRTEEGLYFAVKGFRHPEGRVVAYLRYVPDPSGERVKDGCRYRRVYDLDETTKYLRETYPQYVGYVDFLGLEAQSVPVENVFQIYRPDKYLREIAKDPRTPLERLAARFVSKLEAESRVSLGSMGVSGSQLIGLATIASDLDLIVYGDEGRRVHEALSHLRETGGEVMGYDDSSVMKVVSSRWGDTGIELKRFVGSEKRKLLHGYFGGTEYFIRLVRIPDKAEISSKPVGTVKGEATISDDRESIFTPCRYELKEVRIVEPADVRGVTELVSYRGKFTEQARKGNRVEFRGTLEEALYSSGTKFRIVLGGKGDYLLYLL